jgi:hypothetical protein
MSPQAVQNELRRAVEETTSALAHNSGAMEAWVVTEAR